MDELLILGDQELSEVLLIIHNNRESGSEKNLISELQTLSSNGNLCASYHLGLCYIFGQMPRCYNFEYVYPPLKVKTNARYEIDEPQGLQTLISLFDLEREKIKEFQLQGLYDLYKIVEGSSPFFTTNDLKCRPKKDDEDGEDDTIKILFDSADEILEILQEMDYYEIYLDIARNSLKHYEVQPSKDLMKQAIDYLNRIVNAESNFFDQLYYRNACALLGKIMLWGGEHVSRNVRIGVSLLEKSRFDESYLEIVKFLEVKLAQETLSDNQLQKINAKISRCIDRISDYDLKQKMLTQYNLSDKAQEVESDLVNALDRLKNTVATDNDPLDYSKYTETSPESQQSTTPLSSSESTSDATDVDNKASTVAESSVMESSNDTEEQDQDNTEEQDQEFVGQEEEVINSVIDNLESTSVLIDDAGLIVLSSNFKAGYSEDYSDEDDDVPDEEEENPF